MPSERLHLYIQYSPSNSMGVRDIISDLSHAYQVGGEETVQHIADKIPNEVWFNALNTAESFSTFKKGVSHMLCSFTEKYQTALHNILVRNTNSIQDLILLLSYLNKEEKNKFIFPYITTLFDYSSKGNKIHVTTDAPLVDLLKLLQPSLEDKKLIPHTLKNIKLISLLEATKTELTKDKSRISYEDKVLQSYVDSALEAHLIYIRDTYEPVIAAFVENPDAISKEFRKEVRNMSLDKLINLSEYLDLKAWQCICSLQDTKRLSSIQKQLGDTTVQGREAQSILKDRLSSTQSTQIEHPPSAFRGRRASFFQAVVPRQKRDASRLSHAMKNPRDTQYQEHTSRQGSAEAAIRQMRGGKSTTIGGDVTLSRPSKRRTSSAHPSKSEYNRRSSAAIHPGRGSMTPQSYSAIPCDSSATLVGSDRSTVYSVDQGRPPDSFSNAQSYSNYSDRFCNS